MVLHLSLSKKNSSQISMNLPSAVADFDNPLVWMVAISSPISNSSSTALQSFGVRSKRANCSLLCFKSLFSNSLIFIHWFSGTANSTIFVKSFSACCLSLWSEEGDLFVSQNPRECFAAYSPGQILLFANTIR